MNPTFPERESLASLLHVDRVAMVFRLAPISFFGTLFIGLIAWWAALGTAEAQPWASGSVPCAW